MMCPDYRNGSVCRSTERHEGWVHAPSWDAAERYVADESRVAYDIDGDTVISVNISSRNNEAENQILYGDKDDPSSYTATVGFILMPEEVLFPPVSEEEMAEVMKSLGLIGPREAT